MSVTLERLRALKKQAGAVEPHTATSPTPARPISARARADAPASFTGPVDPLAPAPAGRGFLGLVPGPGSTGRPADTSGRTTPPTARDATVASLRRLLALRERPTALAAAARPAAVAAQGPVPRDLPGTEIAAGLRLIESWLPLPVPAGPLSLAFSKRPDDQLDPADVLFFDTETTGLAGGTGTRAFQIGCADWHCGGLRIRQLLITTLGAEKAMLDTFTGWLAPGTVLCSYNGRCYDAPLLATRYRLARRANPLAGLDHVDLLFPTRRRYRGTWENCKLSTIERELLQVVREDDLPGAQAPAAWLDYLRGGSSERLARVCAHNHQDVVTLSLLLARLVDVHAADRQAEALAALEFELAGMDASDALAL